jgi:hypothetical protein
MLSNCCLSLAIFLICFGLLPLHRRLQAANSFRRFQALQNCGEAVGLLKPFLAKVRQKIDILIFCGNDLFSGFLAESIANMARSTFCTTDSGFRKWCILAIQPT